MISLFWNPIWADIRSFTQKDVYSAPSHFQTTRNCSVTLFLNMLHLSLKRSFHAAAAIQRSPHIINFFITKKNSHQRSIPSTYEEVDLSVYGDSPALHNELQTVQHFLRDSVLELSRKKVHNFKIMEINHETVIEKLDCVYNELPSWAKINISFGFVLQSVQNPEEFRYYYAADNNPVFLNPMVLSDDSDLNYIKSMLRQDEFFPNLINQRPDTKWKFYCVTNVTFFVFLLSGVPLGCIEQSIPSTLLRNPIVKCFVWLWKKTLWRQFVYVSCTGLWITW